MKGNYKVSPAKLEALIELVAGGVLTVSAQARALGLNSATINAWKFKSNSNPNDPLFMVDAFGERMSLARAYAIATRFAYNELRAGAEQFSILGRERRTLNQGQYVPKLDPVAFALDEETRILCGYHPLAYALDENGAVIWNTEHVDAPVGLVDRFLGTFPDLQTTTTQNINLKGALTMGVTVAPKVDYSQAPPPLPAAPVVPLLEVEVIPDNEIVDDDLADLLGPDPVAIVADEPDDEPLPLDDEPRPVVAKPEIPIKTAVPDAWRPAATTISGPVAIDAPPARAPASNLEVELYARLEEARARAKGAPQ
jgi:hypothetical protein